MSKYYLYINISTIIGIISWITLGYYNFYNRYLSIGFGAILLICLNIILISIGIDEK